MEEGFQTDNPHYNPFENNNLLLLHISTIIYSWIITPISIDLVYLSIGGDRGKTAFWGIHIPVISTLLSMSFYYFPILILLIIITFILYINQFFKNRTYSKVNIINLISNIIFTLFYLIMTLSWIDFIRD